MTNFNNWPKYHELSDEEYEAFFDQEEHFSPVFAMAPQPAPGIAFSKPEGYVGIFCTLNNDYFEILEDNDDEPPTIVYLGKDLTTEQTIDEIVKFIADENYETPAAVYFHFDESKFDATDNVVPALRDIFWVRGSWFEPEATKEINNKLLSTNAIYKKHVSFLQNPTDPKFGELLRDVQELGDFSSIYVETP